MIKADLINLIRQQVGAISADAIACYVDFIFETIAKCLENGESVKITNFGVFDTIQKKERIGRNPKTKEPKIISARKIARFHASNNLLHRFNGTEKAAEANLTAPQIHN